MDGVQLDLGFGTVNLIKKKIGGQGSRQAGEEAGSGPPPLETPGSSDDEEDDVPPLLVWSDSDDEDLACREVQLRNSSPSTTPLYTYSVDEATKPMHVHFSLTKRPSLYMRSCAIAA